MNKPEIINDGELAYLREANMSLGSFSKGFNYHAKSPKKYKAAIGQYADRSFSSLDAGSSFQADNQANFRPTI
jgi:hypothetical protein